MPQDTPKRILFIRPSALGDVCRSVPVVASLQAYWPDTEIDWLVQADFAHAISAHPAVHETILFERNELRRWYFPRGFFKMICFLRLLKAKNYDLVLDGQGLGRSGLFAWGTKAQRRIGSKHAREFGWLGYNERVQVQAEHTVDQMLALSEAVGAPMPADMQLYVRSEDTEWWVSFQEEHVLQKYVVVAPTSRWKSKQWPIERFVTVAQAAQEKGYAVVVVGAPSEADQIQELVELEGVVNVLPVLTVGRLLAVIAKAHAVVANDSAVLHIAVGFSRPILGLYGPTNPAVVGPYKQESSVLAAKVDYNNISYRSHSLGDSIMRTIEVDEVISKLGEILDS